MNYNIVKNNLIKYKNSNKKFTFNIKKNNNYILDGFINYKINTTNLSCACSKYFCEHIIYFLVEICKINITNLLFFNKIKKDLILLLKTKSDFSIINQKINDFVNNDLECIICYYSLLEKKFSCELVECSNCYNQCHKYCFELYKSKNAIFLNSCIYCKIGLFT